MTTTSGGDWSHTRIAAAAVSATALTSIVDLSARTWRRPSTIRSWSSTRTTRTGRSALIGASRFHRFAGADFCTNIGCVFSWRSAISAFAVSAETLPRSHRPAYPTPHPSIRRLQSKEDNGSGGAAYSPSRKLSRILGAKLGHADRRAGDQDGGECRHASHMGTPVRARA